MAGKRAAAAAALDPVTEVQWEAARLAFKDGLKDDRPQSLEQMTGETREAAIGIGRYY